MSRRLRLHTAGLAVVALLGGAPIQAAGSTSNRATAGSPFAAIRIDNFGRINDKYFRGAQPQGDDFRALAGIGVKLVIDLASEGSATEEAASRAAGMSFVRIPMTTHQPPSADVIAQFLSLVNDPANQPVYVHCMGGRHRTGVMTAIYRMTIDGWNPAKAFAEMKQYKFGADFLHPEFKAFIQSYTVAAPAPVAAR